VLLDLWKSLKKIAPRKDQRSRKDVEREAAFRLSLFIQREFGLSPKETSVALDADMLRLTMEDALTPIGHTIAQSSDGPMILQSVYTMLHQTHRAQMETLITRIVGRPVWRSEILVDILQGNVSIEFQLELSLK
jgi:uncharacterized protein YbcI